MVDIGFTNFCNNNCIMCTSMMPPNENYKEPTLVYLKELVDSSALDEPVNITGGEPTIRKEILEFMHYINKVKPAAEINMITNSRIFSYPETVIRFKSIKNLKIITELYGSNAELHDEITESEGSYDQTFAGIKNLIEAGYYVEYRIVISKKNYNDIAKMAKMIAEYFSTVERVVIFPIDYVGNAFLNKKNVQVRYCDIVPFVENATDILNDSKIQTKYYHIPYCVLKKRFHRYVQKGMTVPERRVALAEVCKGCLHEEDCPRVWRTYLKTFGMNEFKAIKVT